MDKIIGIYLGGLAVGVAVEVVVARKMENMKDVFGRPIGIRHWLAWQYRVGSHTLAFLRIPR